MLERSFFQFQNEQQLPKVYQSKFCVVRERKEKQTKYTKQK